jgi:hypothetical protein
MNRLPKQKIEFGVRVKKDEIVGERERINTRKRGRWWWLVEKRMMKTRSLNPSAPRPAKSATLPRTLTALTKLFD